MSTAVLGNNHQLTVFTTSLFECPPEIQTSLIERTLVCILFQFNGEIGESHEETLRFLLTSSSILKHQGHFPEAGQFLTQLLDEYKKVHGSYSYQASHAVVDQAYILMHCQNLVEAERLILLGMRKAEPIQDHKGQVKSRIRYLVALARLRERDGNVIEKRSNLELALSIGKENLSDDYWMMTDARASLFPTER